MIKQKVKKKVKKGIKHVKNVVQSWHLRLYQTSKIASWIQTWSKCNKNIKNTVKVM